MVELFWVKLSGVESCNGIKQFHLMCTFIIWCLFSSLTKCSEKSLGTVVILPLIHIGDLWLTFSSLKQLILDQTRQNRYQQFHLMCTFIIWCLFSSWTKYSEKSLGTVVILPLSYIHIGDIWLTFSPLKQVILDQTRQNGYQTVPFSLYIHNLMFVFILE